jgi:hypothetical protein
MNICQIRDLALKLLGLNFLFRALSFIPSLGGLFASMSKPGELTQIMLASVISILLPFAFWMACGFILVFRTAFVASRLWSAEKTVLAAGEPVFPRLSFWIVVIGFFFFIEALGSTVADVWVFFIRSAGQSSQTNTLCFIPHFVALVISMLCMGNARTIERILDKKTSGAQSGV